jgi:hypothetical protein
MARKPKAEIKAKVGATAERIVDLIRQMDGHSSFSVGRRQAISLIESYAAVVASEAAIKAVSDTYDSCKAITDAALSAPLTRTPAEGAA